MCSEQDLEATVELLPRRPQQRLSHLTNDSLERRIFTLVKTASRIRAKFATDAEPRICHAGESLQSAGLDARHRAAISGGIGL